MGGSSVMMVIVMLETVTRQAWRESLTRVCVYVCVCVCVSVSVSVSVCVGSGETGVEVKLFA